MLATVARTSKADDPTPRAVVTGAVVDEAGKHVAGARVSTQAWEPVEPATTGDDGGFRLSLPVNSAGRVYATLVARAADDRVGVKSVFFEASKPEQVTITVKPPRPLEVRVVDGAGQPVADAEVHALANFEQVAGGRTDRDGRWTTKVPADLMTTWRVYALKSKVGFDYAQAERARGSADPPRPLPERLTLTLDGVRPPLRIKAVDREGKPLAGVAVGPWLIQKPARESTLNGITDAFRTTDADGIAAIDWLPARQEGKLSITARPPRGYYAPEHSVWLDTDSPAGDVTLTFLPLESLSGRVTLADGRPAAGATVRAQGQGASQNGYHGEARTDADGRFRLSVYSEQAYILTATKDELTAPYRSGVVVRAGKPIEGVDLVLGPGTRLKGQVTVGQSNKPVGGVSVSAVIDKGSIPPELKREGDRYYHAMTMWMSTQTDPDGRYEFLLGPGEYRVQGPARVDPVQVTIPADNAPRALVRDFHMPRAERGPFTVTVVDEAGQPVPDAVVDGAYRSFTDYFTRIKTDAHGTVRLERSLDPLIVVASTPDRARAGFVDVDAEATEAKVVVKPAATAEGRLVDPQGKPIAGQELLCGIRVQLGQERNGPFSHHFGGKTITGGRGEFQFAGLLVGQTYDLYLHPDASGRLAVAKAPAKPATPGTLALGDVTIDLSPPKPYVPPTPEQRTSQAFAARSEKTPREKLDDTLVEAKREYTRPLLLFGAPKDPLCVALFRLFNESSNGDGAKEKSPADLRWEFELASLDTSRADVQALAKELGIGNEGAPCLAVLSDEGKLAATYPLHSGSDKKLDPRALAAFLREHKLPTRDAEAMLSEGLAQAKRDDRRVFLIMSASWCGPCRLLARFLTAHKAELSRHYVFVKLDVSRDAHAQELLERFEGKNAGNGIPWYVILDPDGKLLVTSNARDDDDAQRGSSNIGFPSSKDGIDHFIAMLRQTAPRLSDEALATLRRGLEKTP